MPKRTRPAGRSHAPRPAPDTRSPALRSAVTNGTRMFVDGDESSPWTRRFRDLVELHLDDLGPRDSLSEAQRSIVRHTTALEVQLEQIEAAMSRGEKVNLDLFQRSLNSLTRALKTLGIHRQAKSVTVTLADILREGDAA